MAGKGLGIFLLPAVGNFLNKAPSRGRATLWSLPTLSTLQTMARRFFFSRFFTPMTGAAAWIIVGLGRFKSMQHGNMYDDAVVRYQKKVSCPNHNFGNAHDFRPGKGSIGFFFAWQ